MMGEYDGTADEDAGQLREALEDPGSVLQHLRVAQKTHGLHCRERSHLALGAMQSLGLEADLSPIGEQRC